MIYLIGGTPRVGKTTLSKMLMDRNHIPFIPLDALTHALDHAYPSLEIRKGNWDTIPDKFFPFLKEVVASMEWTLPNSTIEGDSFLPRHVAELAKSNQIRCVFLGTDKTSLEQIKGISTHDDWVSGIPEEEQIKLPARLVEMSEIFKKGCDEENLMYFNMADGREAQLEAAYKYLMES